MTKPETKFVAGSISATVWMNKNSTKDGKDILYHTVSFAKRYRDKLGEWHDSNSMRLTDLPKAMVVLGRAYEYLVLKENKKGFEEDNSEPIEKE